MTALLASLVLAQTSGTPPVRNLVPLPIFPLVTASLEADELERAKAALDTGIVLALERISRDLDFDVKRLADKVVLDACLEARLQPPDPKLIWTQAELRALARKLGLRFCSQVVLDRITFKSVGIGGTPGSLQCVAECRFWIADTLSLKPPPREFVPVRLARTLDNAEVLDWMAQGVNPRVKLIESTVSDLISGTLDKYLAPLVRTKRQPRY